MTEQDILSQFGEHRPALRAWGGFVVYAIERRLRLALGSRTATRTFLKIPPVPRLKDEAKLVEKALYRGKGYADPYEEVTDKVGVRFVVLLTRDVLLIKSILEKVSVWEYSLDRDFEEERRMRPYEFNYQAVHYVLRPTKALSIYGTAVPRGLPCEVQIKTLLQHAYAELTHDLTYKPRTSVAPDVLHEAAKGMALTETADELFMSATAKFEASSAKYANRLAALRTEFLQLCGPTAAGEDRFNLAILEELDPIVDDAVLAAISSFIASSGVTAETICRRQPADYLFRQPIVLLLMYLLTVRQSDLEEAWPLAPELLKGVYAVMGISPAAA